jgi:hypothetical protein
MSDFCPDHSATCQALDKVQALQDDLRKSGGTIEKIYEQIGKRIPWATFTFIVVIFSSIVGVTFVQLHTSIKELQYSFHKMEVIQASMQTTLNRIDKVVNHYNEKR